MRKLSAAQLTALRASARPQGALLLQRASWGKVRIQFKTAASLERLGLVTIGSNAAGELIRITGLGLKHLNFTEKKQ